MKGEEERPDMDRVVAARIARAKRELETIIDCVDDLVVQVDQTGLVRRCNRSFAVCAGLPYLEILGRNWEELLAAAGFKRGSDGPCERGCREYRHSPSGRIFCCRYYPPHPAGRGKNEQPDREEGGQVITLQEVTEQITMTERLRAKNQELAAAYQELKVSHVKLLQHEKMAAIGQLAAGVAHEINNPVGFVTSNLGALSKYVRRLQELGSGLLGLLQQGAEPRQLAAAAELRQRLKIDLIEQDLPELLKESLDGVERVKVIVQNLKNFSRQDQARYDEADINQCLEETLGLIRHELKHKAVVRKNYGQLPPVWCYPQQLNQVFLNLLMNAVQALKEKGVITIRTRATERYVTVIISDNGCGIAREHLPRLFEPFFTTKEVGQGTGLGLSIAYDIVVKQHGGEITAASEPGAGTAFRIMLPIRRSAATENSETGNGH